jgi:hypothetical protein
MANATTPVIQINEGNVGIGTASPSNPLEISSTTSAQLRLTRNAGTEYSTLYSDSAGGLIISSYSSGSSNYQIFSINSSEKLRIINNGNVGIGTTNPGYLLDLSKTAGGDTYSGINLQASNYGYTIEGGLTQNVGGELIFSSNNAGTRAPRVKFAPNGNVTIKGTGTKLQWERASDNAAGIVYLTKTEDLGSNGSAKLHGYDGIIFTTAGTETERMRITSAGNVSIGNTNNVYKLDVRSTTAGNISVYGRMAAASGSGSFGIQGENTSTAGTAYGIGGYASGAATTNVGGIFSASGATNNYGLLVTNGNVGIGTTSPGAKLSIGGASGELLKLDDSSATGNPFISIWQAGVRRSYIQYVDSSDNLTFASEYGGMVFMTGTGGTETEKMRITSTGNVGIGETSPSQKLHVAGNARVTGAYYDSGDLPGSTGEYLKSTITGTTWASIPAYKFYLLADSPGTSVSISDSVVLDIAGGTNISTVLTGAGSSGDPYVVTANLDNDITINTVEYTNPVSSGQYYGEIAGFGGIDNALAAGELAVLKTSLGSGMWFEADYNTSINATGMLGIYTGSEVLLRGKVRLSTYSLGTANGAPVYMGVTGAISLSAPTGNGDFVRIIGYVTDYAGDEIYFCPDNTWVEITA